MGALWLVVVCLGAGMLTARLRHPEGLAHGLNWWVLNIALPALVLVKVVQLEWSPMVLFPALALWLVFLGSCMLMTALGRWYGWSRGQTGALMLTAGLGNTSFVGFPLIESLRGSAALGPAVIADQLGSFLVLSTGGLIVAALYSGQRPQASALALRILRFPAFIALLLALALQPLGPLPEMMDEVLLRLGQTLTPLALFSVGLQLRLRAPRTDAAAMVWGLGWKLVAAPLLVLGLALGLGLNGEMIDITVLQAGMAPMVSAGILAQQHGLAPALASRMVGIGVLLSLLTVPLLNQLLLLR